MSGGALVVRIESCVHRMPSVFLAKPLDLAGLVALIERRVGGDSLPLAAGKSV